MNLSGQAVAPLARQFGLVPAKIIVIADDVALRVGRVRFKPKGGPGGHNGHKSLIQALGTNEYPRIKIGVGVPEDDLVEHVLGKFNLEEQQRIKEAMKLVVLGCERVCKEGLEPAISAVNTLSEQ